MGKVATSPLPSRGSPSLQSGGKNQKWPTCGQSGYVTPAVSGIPTAAEWWGGNQKWPTCGQSGYVTPAVSGIPTAAERGGGKSEVAHLWAKWLRHPCRLGDPHRCRAGGKIRSGPLVGKVATSPLPSRASPLLQSGEQNQKWPTSGQSGYVTPTVSGIPTASERGAKSEVAHLWAKWLRHPCRLGDPHRFRAGGKIRSGPLMGRVATSTVPSRGAPPLQSGGQNQKWPTYGQSGYVSPAVSGIPTASERGAKSEVAHLWANWLRHPCRLGDPHRFRAGGKIRSGPLMGKVATSTVPSRGAPPLQSGGQNQKWPTSAQSGYVTPAVSGNPTASERGAKSEVAHLWAKWLRQPCRFGEPHRCRAGGKIRGAPQVGKVATSPLPSRGAPPLQSGGQNQKWPTYGQSGYVNRVVLGSPTAAERGAKSEVPHKWAKWLRHPCRLGDPHRCRAGGKIRSGPQVRKVATSPLPSRGSPPLHSGGQNQRCPTCGQSGYVTLAVSGIPTAAERGAKSEVAHLWAKWLRHPCRPGYPLRFRAGGKIRSGPLVGKVATSPLPSRGSPPLQSGGQNQRCPTCGQSGYVTPAVSGIPTASERGAKSEVAHLWAKWLRHPCRLGDPTASERGAKSEVAHLWAKWLRHPCRLGDPHSCKCGEQKQKWPTSVQSGYVTPAVSGIPTAAQRGGKSEVAHLWAKWLRHPCRLRDPHRCRAEGEIRSGLLVGKVATSPLPSRGSPPLQSGGGESEVAHLWAKWLRHPCRLGDPHRFRAGGKIRSGPFMGKVATSPLPSRGSPPLQSGGGKSEVAHLWAKWLRHPCRLGDPHRCRAGGEIRGGPLVGKVATSPLPSRGSPPLQSGGQNQKWPTCGQSGYVTPAVSGIPTASERGGKSEVAHLWAKWLHHPCHLGDPHHCIAGGGGIRSGPLMGKVATSSLPPRVSPALQSGGENQKWPTCGQSGYVTRAVSGFPTASERGAKSEVPHLWAKWLCHPCRLGDPHRFRAGSKIRSGPLMGKVATSPLPSRGSPPLQSGEQNQKWPTYGQSGYVTPAVSGIPTAVNAGSKSRSGPQVYKVATSPLPSRGSPPLHSGGGNQKWPTCGQSGYVTPAVSGIPTAAERRGKSEVAYLWAKWLRHPCRLGDPHRFRAGGGIRSGPLVGKVATSPLPSRGSPPLQSGGQNQKWPIYGQSGYVTPAVSGIPTAAERGGEIRSGPLVGKVATSPLPSRGSPPLQSGGGNQRWPTCGQSGYVTPAVSGIPTASERGAKSEVAHLWAKWLRHPCRLGDPHRFRAGGEIRSGPLMGKVATSPLPSRGSPPLHSGGGGGESEVAHLWAKWLRHPCRLGDPHRFRAGGKIRSGPLVGKVATSPLPSRGSPPLQSGGENQKWPNLWARWLHHPCHLGHPHHCIAGGGGGSEVAHLWAKWLRHPCRLGDPHRYRAGGGGGNQKWPTYGQSGYVTPAVSGIPTAVNAGSKSRSGPQVYKVATSPLPSRGSPPLHSGGGNQKWPTCGQSGYVTPAVSGIPTAAERRGKSEVAYLWAKWLRHPCRLGDPHRFRAGGEIRSGPLVGKVATSPLPSRGSPPLQSGGQNQKWPIYGQSGYVNRVVLGSHTAAERGAKSEVPHKWAKWLRHPCRLGDPHRCRAGGKIRSGPQVRKVATSPLPSRGSPPLQSGGQNQRCPTCGQSGYVTLAVSGIPTAAERGAKSEVAHLWAKWLRHPCRPGYPLRFRAGGKIRSGPLVGKVATSPLPSRGSPPLQSGGQNQRCPTCGQSGDVTPAVSGIPTASERGAKSEVAHLWAKWLRHPCRLGDPHRFRAGSKIRSGPLMGKVATSPLPSRGSPQL